MGSQRHLSNLRWKKHKDETWDDETSLSALHSFAPLQDREKGKQNLKSYNEKYNPKNSTQLLERQPEQAQNFPWSDERYGDSWNLQAKRADIAKDPQQRAKVATKGNNIKHNSISESSKQEHDIKDNSQPLSKEQMQHAVVALTQISLTCTELFSRARSKDTFSNIKIEVDNQEARFKIWLASYMPLIQNLGHDTKKDNIDIILGMLHRLSKQLDELVEKKQVYYSTLDDNGLSSPSSQGSLIFDSTPSESAEAKTSTEGFPFLSRQLRRINRVVSHLYRYANALYKGKTAQEIIPLWSYHPWILEQFRARLKWCIQLQYPRLSRTSALYRRFIATCELRTRRLSSGADRLGSLLRERQDTSSTTYWR